MWKLVEGMRGLKEAAEAIHLKEYPDSTTPFISGNVSLYNESKQGSINASAIVACVATIKDYRKAITMQFKKTDSVLLLIGERKDECGGSEYYKLHGEYGKNVPQPNFQEVQNQIYSITDAIDSQLILSAHDISEGGLAVTLAEMTMRGEIGFDVDLGQTGNISTDKKMFSETGGFVLEVTPDNVNAIQEIYKKHNIEPIQIGTTTSKPELVFQEDGNLVIKIDLQEAQTAWHESLRLKMFN